MKIINVIRMLVMPFACIFAFADANATSMCMNSDIVSIILDPSIGPTDYTYNASAFTWSVTAPYGNLSGIATCNTTSGSWATAYPQYNFDAGTTTGVYCWCKMLRPVRSAWVCSGAYSSTSDCASICAFNCGDRVRINGGFRGGVFGSAGN